MTPLRHTAIIFGIIALVLALCGCGSYPLASSVSGDPSPVRTAAIQDCRVSARDYAHRPEARQRAFVTGFLLPVVGIAVGASVERDEARGEFARCMRGKGFGVGEVG